jgi:hypothetical protein
MKEMFVNLTCIHQTPVNSNHTKHKSWSQRGLVKIGFTVIHNSTLQITCIPFIARAQ